MITKKMCVKFSMHRSVVHFDNVDGFFEKFECESYIFIRPKCNYRSSGRNRTCGHTNRSCLSPMVTVCYYWNKYRRHVVLRDGGDVKPRDFR